MQLFDYLGLDKAEDEAVMKRRIKALRSKLLENPGSHGKLRKGEGINGSACATDEEGGESDEAEGGAGDIDKPDSDGDDRGSRRGRGRRREGGFKMRAVEGLIIN